MQTRHQQDVHEVYGPLEQTQTTCYHQYRPAGVHRL
jgi:hypothetical protein